MANKSVYQDFEADALIHFGMESAPIYGVLTSTGVEDVLVTQDQTTYEKIRDLLIDVTESELTFINKKKAFIMPGCSVSQDRLKSALKEHKITVTNDYEKADLIVGHDDISLRSDDGRNIPVSKLLAKLWNYETIDGSTSGLASLESYSNPIILTEKITERIRYYNLDILDSIYDTWLITGMALNMAYRVETGKMSVVDPETVLHCSANKMVLDEELLTDLTRQFRAGGDDAALAAKILPTIDYTKNYHLFWRLAQNVDNNLYNFRRDKDMQYWLSQSDFNAFYRRSAQDMIQWLEEEGKLDAAAFRYLEPIVRREISINNRDLYVFKVSVKKEYQQYLKTKNNEKKI
jgi:hypothetical protein